MPWTSGAAGVSPSGPLKLCRTEKGAAAAGAAGARRAQPAVATPTMQNATRTRLFTVPPFHARV